MPTGTATTARVSPAANHRSRPASTIRKPAPTRTVAPPTVARYGLETASKGTAPVQAAQAASNNNETSQFCLIYGSSFRPSESGDQVGAGRHPPDRDPGNRGSRRIADEQHHRLPSPVAHRLQRPQ